MNVFQGPRQELISRFCYLLRNTTDDRKDANKVIDFLFVCLHFKESTPPTTEFITILKKQKPILFYRVKQSVSPTSPIYLLLQLQMDYDQALERLGLTQKELA